MSKSKPPRRRQGAPTKCTLNRCAALANDIKYGASLNAACGAAGITHRTLDRWQVWADEGKAPYKEFCLVLKNAVQYAIKVAEKKVYRGVPGWQGAARWLQAMQSQRWGHWVGHEPPPPVTTAQVQVNVDLGKVLTNRMARLVEQPPMRGLPMLRGESEGSGG